VHITASIYMALLFVTASSAAIQQPQQTTSASSSITPKSSFIGATQEPPAPRSLVAPFFVETDSIHSQLTLLNSSPLPLGVDMIVSGAAGEQLAREPLTIAPRSEQLVELATLLHARSYWHPVYGSIYLLPSRRSQLAAQLSITSDTNLSYKSSDIEEELTMLGDTEPTNYRAVTSALSAPPIIAVRSMSSVEQVVSISCIVEGKSAQTYGSRIAPNQTLLLQVCGSSAARPLAELEDALPLATTDSMALGLSVSSAAPSSQLAVFAIGIHGAGDRRSFSAIPFWDANTLKSSKAVYPGVHTDQLPAIGLSAAALRVSIANFSNSAKTATVFLTNGSQRGSGQTAVATLTVPAAGVITQELPTNSMDLSSQESLVIHMDGRPGELLSDVQAMLSSPEGPSSITVPWKDQGQTDNGGQHPWFVSDSVSSTVFLFNPDPTRDNESVYFTIYAGQQTWTKRLSVPALATTSISISDIINSGQVDDKGRHLDSRISQGIITWSTLANPRVFGKLMQVNHINGIARAYACGQVIVNCGKAYLNPSTLHAWIGGTTDSVGVYGVDACQSSYPCLCDTSCPDGSSGYENTIYWESSNSSIASVLGDPTSDPGDFQGNGVGQATASVYVGDNIGCTDSGSAPITVGGPDHVKVISDQGGFPADCPDTGVYVREMTMQLVDNSGAAIINNNPTYSVQEAYQNSTPNTCGNGNGTPTSCTSIGYGQWNDFIAISGTYCGSGIPQSSGCGNSYTAVWSMCGYPNLTNTVWTSPRTVLSNSITVNGQAGSFATGTELH
jgi:hypothetical protein